MVLEVGREESGATLCIADGAVDEKFGIEEICGGRGRIVGIREFVATGNTSDAPLFGLERAVVADEGGVSDCATMRNVLFFDKFDGVRRFDTILVSLRQATDLVAESLRPSGRV